MAPKFAIAVKMIFMIVNVIVSLLILMLLGIGTASKTVGFISYTLYALYLVAMKNTIALPV
jgi:hypothetical protein